MNWNFIHEDGSAFHMEDRPYYKVFMTGVPQSNIMIGMKRQDSLVLWLKMNAQPLYSDDFKDVNSVLITFSDITEYQKSKRELEKYLQIIDAHVIISSTDLHGIITEVSEAFCKIRGIAKKNLLAEVIIS